VEHNRLGAAREVCQKGLQLYPKDVELLFRRGIVAHRLQHLEEAAQAYEQVLASNEELHFASIDESIKGYKTHNNLALVYREMGRLLDAESQWRLAVEREPVYRQGWRSLGECLIQQMKFDAAVCLATELMAKETLHREGVLLRVRLSEAQGSLDDAMRHLNGLLCMRPWDKEALDIRCRILFCQGNYAAAKAELLQLTILDPTNASAHQNLGTAYLQTGDFQAAERSYRTSLKLRPNCPVALCYLGHALQGLGRAEEANGTWREARRLAPEDASLDEMPVHEAATAL
jgi:tetratricopeptide (TPR) repeat protein